MRVTMKKSSLGFGKLFNVLQSLIGRMASRPMRNIETFPSNQMYLCLSLVERKVAEFYLNDLFSLLFPDNWWCPWLSCAWTWLGHLVWLKNVPFWIFDVVKQWINNQITYLCSSLEWDNAHRASYFCPDVDNARYCYFHQMGIFWKWYPACGLYITLMSLRNVRAAHSWFLKSWIWKSTWRYGILKLHVLIMQPSLLHNIWKISDEKRDVRNMKQTQILFHVTRGAGV